jgi:hypothetical protein
MESELGAIALELTVFAIALYLDSYLRGQLTLVRPLDIREMLSQITLALTVTSLTVWMLGGRRCVVSEAEGMCLAAAAVVGANAWTLGTHLSVPVVLAFEALWR